jgi:alpha-tubulin suppressor-like RCC1 family protein
VAVAGELAFASLKAGELSTCGVTSDGAAWCWGDNEYGQLGDGSFASSNVPVKVAFQP